MLKYRLSQPVFNYTLLGRMHHFMMQQFVTDKFSTHNWSPLVHIPQWSKLHLLRFYQWHMNRIPESRHEEKTLRVLTTTYLSLIIKGSISKSYTIHTSPRSTFTNYVECTWCSIPPWASPAQTFPLGISPSYVVWQFTHFGSCRNSPE